jgi:hypothetical protein
MTRCYWQTSWRRADRLSVHLLLATLRSCCFGQQAPGLSDLILEQLTKVDVYTASGYLQREGRNVGRYVDISASIYNLLDKSYTEPTSAANLEKVTPQDGRAFRAKMIWHWDNLTDRLS